MSDTREYRDVLYWLGYSNDDQVVEPLRSAIIKFDKFVVPRIYRDDPDMRVHWMAFMAKQLAVALTEANASEDLIAKLLEAAVEEMQDERGLDIRKEQK